MRFAPGCWGRATVAGILRIAGVTASAQIADYDWYRDFRPWAQESVPAGERTPQTLADRYTAKLKAEGSGGRVGLFNRREMAVLRVVPEKGNDGAGRRRGMDARRHAESSIRSS